MAHHLAEIARNHWRFAGSGCIDMESRACIQPRDLTDLHRLE